MNNTKTYLQYLAKAMHRDFYSDVKQWEVSDHEMTIISQIDNMYAGIRDKLNGAGKLPPNGDREANFREAFEVFMESQGAAYTLTDDHTAYGLATPVFEISFDSTYDDDGNCLTEYLEFNL